MSVRTRSVRHQLALIVVAGVLFGSVFTPRPSSAASTPPATGTYLGAYVQPDDWSRAGQEASMSAFESALGRKLSIDHTYFAWDSTNFPNWRPGWDLQTGRIPMLSWGATRLDQVVNGASDAMIRDRATKLAALAGPVLLRWFAEMDAVIYDNDEIQSPAQFISAWRRVHDIFQSQGATNVQWVWCPNAYAFQTGEAQQMYPGDAYVDWICADGYNWSPARPGAGWNPFRSIFSAFYAWGAPKTQPLMIGETGVMEAGLGAKASWITDMGNTIKYEYPEIKALVYMDAYTTANFGGWYDWRLDTSTSAFDAFRTLAADPFFNGSGVVVVGSGGTGAGSGSGSGGSVGGGVGGEGSGASNGSSGTMLFYDGFESGTSGWTGTAGMTLQSGSAHSGSWAAQAQATGGVGAYALKSLSTPQASIRAQTWVNVSSHSSVMNILRLRTSSGANILTVFVSSSGELMIRNDVRKTVVWSPTRVPTNSWHQIQVRVWVAGASSQVEVWYDARRVGELSRSLDLGTSPVAQVMIGDNVPGRTFRALFDDIAASKEPI